MSLLMGVSGLIGILMGRFTDKSNVRAVITIGAVVGTASYLLLATMDSLWHLYLGFGLGAGICLGCAYTPVNATISRWFGRRSALALGVALMGITVGQMVLSPVVDRIISVHGWRTAYVVLGIVVFVCAVPAVILMGRAPTAVRGGGVREDATEGPQGHGPLQGYSVREAAKTPPFWMLIVTGLVISAGFYIVVAHIAPCATDLGISSSAASFILTVSGVGGIAGTLPAWPLTGKLGSRYALLVLIVGEALGMFLFMVTRSAWGWCRRCSG